MKHLIPLFAGALLWLTACDNDGTQFTSLSEMEAPPFEQALESRVNQETVEEKIGRKKDLSSADGAVGQNAFKRDVEIDISLNIRESEKPVTGKGSGKKTKPKTAGGHTGSRGKGTKRHAGHKARHGKKTKVDIHFYINPLGIKYCLNTFARTVYKTGFLSHLNHLSWRFSHSVFTDGENPPGNLEFDGQSVSDPKRAFKRKSIPQTVLTKRFRFYEDIFAYTVTPFTERAADPIYVTHNFDSKKDGLIQYDAPVYPTNYSVLSKKLPSVLDGLDDLLTQKYDAIRDDSRVEVFILTGAFPEYTDEDIENFTSRHKRVRIHHLKPTNNKESDALIKLSETTGGATEPLCQDENIGLRLTEIVTNN